MMRKRYQAGLVLLVVAVLYWVWRTARASFLSMGKICPECGTTQIAESNGRNLLDHILHRIGLRPYRCQLCSTRFYRQHISA